MTSAVYARKGHLIDIFPGRDAKAATGMVAICYLNLIGGGRASNGRRWTLSGAYRVDRNRALPQAVQVADLSRSRGWPTVV